MSAVRDPFAKKFWLMIGIRLVIAGTLIACTIAIGFDITKRTGQIQKLDTESAFRKNLASNFSLLKHQSEQALSYADFFSNALPDRDQLISFPREAQTLAQQNQVTLGFNFREGTAATEGAPGFTAFQMSASGELPKLIQFLKAFENTRLYININTIDMSKSEKGERFSSLVGGRIFSR